MTQSICTVPLHIVVMSIHRMLNNPIFIFIAEKWTEPLPDSIDDVVPVDIRHLVKFVQPLAHCWDRIGHSLSVNTVKQLVGEQGDGASKMTRVFETWVDRRPKWRDLLRVLDEMELTATAIEIRAFLHTGQ